MVSSSSNIAYIFAPVFCVCPNGVTTGVWCDPEGTTATSGTTLKLNIKSCASCNEGWEGVDCDTCKAGYSCLFITGEIVSLLFPFFLFRPD